MGGRKSTEKGQYWDWTAGATKSEGVEEEDRNVRGGIRGQRIHIWTYLPQSGIYLIVVFIESKAFTRRPHELARDAADSVLDAIQKGLVDNPVRGDLVKGLGGIRKARISNPTRGKGKRGGFRYMYLYLERKGHIHLLFLFDKDEQEDLNPAQRVFLRQLVERIKE
jgi:hypothetical protein